MPFILASHRLSPTVGFELIVYISNGTLTVVIFLIVCDQGRFSSFALLSQITLSYIFMALMISLVYISLPSLRFFYNKNSAEPIKEASIGTMMTHVIRIYEEDQTSSNTGFLSWRWAPQILHVYHTRALLHCSYGSHETTISEHPRSVCRLYI